MRLKGLIGISLGAVAMLTGSLGHAQEVREDLTSMLPCEGKCAVMRHHERISGSTPRFPVQYLHDNVPEAVVEIRFTVLPDGSVSEDMEVERLIGPPGFVTSAKSALLGAKYKPATLEGKPIANMGRFRVIFAVGNLNRGVRPTVSSAYKGAGKLIEDGKLDQAEAMLAGPLAEPRLNFAERGPLLYLLASIAVQRQNFVDAQRHSATAMMFSQDSMPTAIWRSLRRINILSLLNLGNIVGAVHAVDRWKKAKDFDATDPVVLEVEAARKRMESLRIFAARGRIPAVDEADGFAFGLYRRKFAFTNVRGRLERFTLNCNQHQSRSPISEDVEWSIPKNFSDCFLFIKGEPGTTFDIVQFAN